MTDYTHLLSELSALQERVTLSKDHRYRLDREPWPGVTTAIKVMDAPFLDRWTVRVQVEGTARAAYANPPREGEELEAYVERMKVLGEAEKEHERLSNRARVVGVDVHKLIEWELKTAMGEKLPEPVVCEEALYRFSGFRQWAKDVGLKPLAVEARVFYPRTPLCSTGYCGTVDALVLIEGKPTQLDWKPSDALWNDRRLQSAAYRKALVSLGWPEMAGAIVCVPREGGDISMVYAEPPGPALEQAFDAFLALLRVYRWQLDVEKRKRAERRA